MLLRLFKSNGPLVNFFYLVVAVLLWLPALLKPEGYSFYNGENQGLLYAPLFSVTEKYPLLQVIIALLIVLFLSFLIQQIKISFSLIKIRTKLAAAVFILLSGGFTALHTLHPVYFAAIFMMLALYSLFSVFNNPEPVTHFFNAGLFISLGMLFYFNTAVLLPAFLFSVSVMRREPRFRDYVVLFIGFLVPWLFAFSYAFFADRLNEVLFIFRDNIMTPVSHFFKNYLLIGYGSLLILLTLIGSVKMMQVYDMSKVSTRKYFSVLFIIFFFTILGFTLIPAASQEMLILSIIPLSFLIANLFTTINSVFWSEFLFTLLVLATIFMQVARYFLVNG